MNSDNNTAIIMYQTEDGVTKIDVRIENDTVWLTQAQIAELFQRDRSVITKHIRNILSEEEVLEQSNVQFLHIPNSDKRVAFYSLDVVISVGYRVKSLRGTQFRVWASSVLKEYLKKGFAMNDELLKNAGYSNYFDELLARIRDIRSSEKVFWRKVLGIYATSVDYTPSSETSKLFFQTVQNKMHWAAHGHTAPELIAARANAELPYIGMLSFGGERPTLEDAKVAKNYLSEEELDTLNRIVSMYLDFAELQARGRKPMYMKDWISRLDDFLRISEREVLTHAGMVSREVADAKANLEFRRYQELRKNDLSRVELGFMKSLEESERKLTER